MTKRIVVTGANSYLGSHTVETLLTQTTMAIDGFITPWAKELPPDSSDGRLTLHRMDLSKPLVPEAIEALQKADAVIHLGWVRGGDRQQVLSLNLAIAEKLMTPLAQKSRFLFVSSAAAAANTRSIYGKTKWETAARVRELGGTVLICGLVVDDSPQGPYELLNRAVAKLPIAIRLTGPGIKVYPIPLPELMDCLLTATAQALPAGTYRMYTKGVPFDTFIADIEACYPRKRLPILVSAKLITGAAALAKQLHLLPTPLADKLLSFFYKDETFLDDQPPIS